MSTNKTPIKSMTFEQSPMKRKPVTQPQIQNKNPVIDRNSNGNIRRYVTIADQTLQSVVKKQTNNTKKSGKTKAAGSLDGFIIRAMAQFQKTISEPQLLIMLAGILFAAYTHHYNVDQSIVNKIVTELRKNTHLKALGDWVEDNVSKAFGIAVFMALCTTLSEKHRYTAMITSAIAIIMMPSASTTFYVITGVSVTLYNRMTVKSDKMITVIIIALVYIYYFLDDGSTKVETTTPSTEPTTTQPTPK